MTENPHWYEKGQPRSADHCARCGRFVGPYGMPQIPKDEQDYAADLLLCVECDTREDKLRPVDVPLEQKQADLAEFERFHKEHPFAEWEKRASGHVPVNKNLVTGLDDVRFDFEDYTGTWAQRQAMGRLMMEMLLCSQQERETRNDEVWDRRARQLAVQLPNVDKLPLERFTIAGAAVAYYWRLLFNGVKARQSREEFRRDPAAHADVFRLVLEAMVQTAEKLQDDDFYYKVRRDTERARKEFFASKTQYEADCAEAAEKEWRRVQMREGRG